MKIDMNVSIEFEPLHLHKFNEKKNIYASRRSNEICRKKKILQEQQNGFRCLKVVLVFGLFIEYFLHTCDMFDCLTITFSDLEQTKSVS